MDDTESLETQRSPIGNSKPIKLLLLATVVITLVLLITYSTRLLHRRQGDAESAINTCEKNELFEAKIQDVIIDESFNIGVKGCHNTILLPKENEMTMDKICDPDPLNFFLLWSTDRAEWKLKHYRVIDSIFTFHPKARVYVITKSMTQEDFAFYSEGYDLIHIVMDTQKIFENTPLERWRQKIPEFQDHKNFFSHLTDAVRLALLWKFGGVYLDTDAFLMRNIDNIRNAVSRQHTSNIGPGNEFNGAVMVFDRMHPFLYYAMHHLMATYDPNNWDSAGPNVITSCLEKWSSLHPYLLRWIPRHEIGQLDLPNEPVGSPFVTAFSDRYAFYPVAWWNTTDRIDMLPEHRELTQYKKDVEERTYVYHYYNQMLNGHHPKEGTYLFELLQRACLFECQNSNLDTPITKIIKHKHAEEL